MSNSSLDVVVRRSAVNHRPSRAIVLLLLGIVTASFAVACGPSTTKQVGGKQIGGANASNTPDTPADKSPDPTAAKEASGSISRRGVDGNHSATTPPPQAIGGSSDSSASNSEVADGDSPAPQDYQDGDDPASTGDENSLIENVRRKATSLLNGNRGEEFSGDREPHRVTEKLRVLKSADLGGALLEIEPEIVNVDRMALLSSESRFDSSRFAADEGSFRQTILSHHPEARRAISDTEKDYSLPDGFTEIEESGKTADGFYWRIRCDADDSIMALVPAGPAVLGTDNGPEESQPRVAVILEGFYIDIHEVTVGQYKTYRNGEQTDKKRLFDATGKAKHDEEPVCGLMWNEARVYATWAGKELPTEAEWEKAARGPGGYQHPWGEGIPVWPGYRDPHKVARVGQYAADLSPYGLFDMAGNAREWVSDWYLPDAHRRLAEGSSTPVRNPTGPKSQGTTDKRVVKGGNDDWLLTARAGESARQREADIGFRCVLRLKPEKKRK